MTLADLLAVPDLALRDVAVTSADAEVRWVATSELVDPTPYLQGGEVLLTTGLGTARWRTKWREYVDRLARAEVAALGLGVGLTHAHAPATLVQACRDAGLNLFEVPRPTAFVAISRAAAALLDDERDQVARRSLDAQRSLTRAALERDDVPALLEALAEQVGGAAATVTREGEPTSTHGSGVDGSVVREEVARVRSQGLRAAASSAGLDGTTLVQPLGVRSRPELWLAVFVPGRPSDVHRAAVATAVSLLSLALEREQDRRRAERRLRERAVELVLTGDPRTARILLDANLPRQVRVVCARGSAEPVDDALAALEQERVLAAVVGEDLVVVSPARRAPSVATLLADRELLVGIGRAVPLAEAAESRETADHALAATTPGAPVRRWDDQAAGGVSGLLDPGRARAFARSYLAPLGDDPALLDTLAAFLRRHGSVLATAEELTVHRNTVRNRIRQIESLLDVSLDDPQVRVDAWVALHAG
ncbi:MAG TPA: PucR family transcriptional regulator [Nocardioides sp.]|nr:PucR family transcriptional regulator [Nocardioides sp.]